MSEPAASYADLHLLVLLANCGSYTAAARRLGISKASVSSRIAALEQSATVPLVRRTTRSLSLTPAGQQLVEGTRSAFVQIDESFSAVRDLASHASGIVRVTAPVALGRQHVAPLLASFLAEYPQVSLELDLTDRLVNLVQEGFDLAIRHIQAPPETHVAWQLCRTQALLVASAAYLRRHGEPRHPSELQEHRCVAYLRSPGSNDWIFDRGTGRRAERVSVPVRSQFRANNSEVLREAVLGGAGVGLLPDFSAAAHVRAGKLVPILPEWRPLGVFGENIYALRPWSAQVPRSVRALVRYLRSRMAGGFAPAE
jgi:DNA-binding transcriptional LysR family regulator